MMGMSLNDDGVWMTSVVGFEIELSIIVTLFVS